MDKNGTVYCETCDEMLPVSSSDEWLRCECGNQFVVTITEMPSEAP